MTENNKESIEEKNKDTMKKDEMNSKEKNIDKDNNNDIAKKKEINSEEKKEAEKPDNQISLLEKFENHLNLLQEKTGIKGKFIIWGFIFILILLYFHIFEEIITNLMGTLYPSFWTMKAIESSSKSHEELKKWLIYWVVFSTFILIDRGFSFIVKFIPFYFFFKLIFLMVLLMPGSEVCVTIYNFFVKTFYGYYEEKIDSYVIGVKEYAKDMLHENNLKSFKNNKTSLKKYSSLGNKNMKEDNDNDNDKKNKA